jgi:hypothetical protein
MLSFIIGKKKIMQYCNCSCVGHRMKQTTAYTYYEGSSRKLPLRKVHNHFNKDKMKCE